MIRSVTGEAVQVSHVTGSKEWSFAPMDLPLESVILVEGIVKKKVMKLKKGASIVRNIYLLYASYVRQDN